MSWGFGPRLSPLCPGEEVWRATSRGICSSASNSSTFAGCLRWSEVRTTRVPKIKNPAETRRAWKRTKKNSTYSLKLLTHVVFFRVVLLGVIFLLGGLFLGRFLVLRIGCLVASFCVRAGGLGKSKRRHRNSQREREHQRQYSLHGCSF